MLPIPREEYTPSPLQISVFLDGSQTSQGAGFRYTIYFGPILTTQGLGPAGARTEVHDAELMGAVEGLRAALNLPCIAYTAKVVILLDNLAAASLLADGRPARHR